MFTKANIMKTTKLLSVNKSQGLIIGDILFVGIFIENKKLDEKTYTPFANEYFM